MSIDYLEKIDAEATDDVKTIFVNFVIDLERHLDRAEEYGEARDMRMLAELDTINSMVRELPEYAQRADEQMPIRDYGRAAEQVFEQFFTNLIHSELVKIDDTMESVDGDREEALAQFKELESVVPFYQRLYSGVDTSEVDALMNAVRVKFH